jgi:hypothetical protein
LKGLGTSVYPLNGFIYQDSPAHRPKPDVIIALR